MSPRKAKRKSPRSSRRRPCSSVSRHNFSHNAIKATAPKAISKKQQKKLEEEEFERTLKELGLDKEKAAGESKPETSSAPQTQD